MANRPRQVGYGWTIAGSVAAAVTDAELNAAKAAAAKADVGNTWDVLRTALGDALPHSLRHATGTSARFLAAVR